MKSSIHTTMTSHSLAMMIMKDLPNLFYGKDDLFADSLLSPSVIQLII